SNYTFHIFTAYELQSNYTWSFFNIFFNSLSIHDDFPTWQATLMLVAVAGFVHWLCAAIAIRHYCNPFLYYIIKAKTKNQLVVFHPRSI
ncbi:MAG: hypothetical protein KAI29_18665, partial [Cyclobacteriaceae bacterium]|nr:hypothetical protein [Cyclobacteriaceae bacterium]